MRVTMRALREQAWRSERLYADLTRFAIQIGCEVIEDEIITQNEMQARQLARWWIEQVHA